MRISTNTIYDTGISKIDSLLSDQAKLQQQIATGRRILTPSDDPVASARALQVSQAQNLNTQYTDNRKIAVTSLSNLDTSLSSITDVISASQVALVGAAGTLSASDRSTLATQLNASMQTLLGLANTQDAAGNYIYAGFQSGTKAFTATATGATYNGDSNQQLLQVDGQRQMAISAAGSNVFQANGNDVFATYSNLIAQLNNPATTQATLTTSVASAITSMKNAEYNVLTIRATVGANLNEIDTLDTAGANRDLQYTQTLAGLQSLDYAKALSDATQQQTILAAAQKSFVATSGLSLFDYIK